MSLRDADGTYRGPGDLFALVFFGTDDMVVERNELVLVVEGDDVTITGGWLVSELGFGRNEAGETICWGSFRRDYDVPLTSVTDPASFAVQAVIETAQTSVRGGPCPDASLATHEVQLNVVIDGDVVVVTEGPLEKQLPTATLRRDG